MAGPSSRLLLTGCVLLLACAAAAAQASSGSSSAAVGADLVVDTPPTVEPTAAAPRASLGRRGGGGELRQPGAGPNGTDVPAARCRPGNGVICSDRDYTGLLQANRAVINLPAENFAYFGLNPTVSASLGATGKLDVGGGGSVSTGLKAGRSGELKGNVGTEVLNVASEDSTTLLSAAVKSNRAELLLPEKVTIALDKAAGSNSVERRTNKPNFYYVLGQNFGLPNGLATVKDGRK